MKVIWDKWPLDDHNLRKQENISIKALQHEFGFKLDGSTRDLRRLYENEDETKNVLGRVKNGVYKFLRGRPEWKSDEFIRVFRESNLET